MVWSAGSDFAGAGEAGRGDGNRDGAAPHVSGRGLAAGGSDETEGGEWGGGARVVGGGKYSGTQFHQVADTRFSILRRCVEGFAAGGGAGGREGGLLQLHAGGGLDADGFEVGAAVHGLCAAIRCDRFRGVRHFYSGAKKRRGAIRRATGERGPDAVRGYAGRAANESGANDYRGAAGRGSFLYARGISAAGERIRRRDGGGSARQFARVLAGDCAGRGGIGPAVVHSPGRSAVVFVWAATSDVYRRGCERHIWRGRCSHKRLDVLRWVIRGAGGQRFGGDGAGIRPADSFCASAAGAAGRGWLVLRGRAPRRKLGHGGSGTRAAGRGSATEA